LSVQVVCAVTFCTAAAVRKELDGVRGQVLYGAGATIEKPAAYFSAVADNKYGYNASYTTGAGVSVEKPSAYYAAVGACP